MKRKRIWGAIGLLALMYMSQSGNAISELGRLGYDYETAKRTGEIYSIFSICLISLIMMAVPICAVIIRKGKLDFESGKKLCRNNSIVLLIISMISLGIFGVGAIGGVGAIIYYFINKWLFVKDEQETLLDNVKEMCSEDRTDLNDENWIMNAKNIDQSQENPKMSLSMPDDKYEPRGNSGVYGYEALKQEVSDYAMFMEQTQQKLNETEDVNSKKVRYCSRCGKIIDPDTKKCTGCEKQYFKAPSPKTVIFILWGIMLALSIVINVVLLATVNKLQNNSNDVAIVGTSAEQLKEENERLKEKLRENTEKLDFVDAYCVFVEDDGSDFYHKYECPLFTGKSFWIYNIDAAEQNGLKPCLHCCN